MRTLIHCVLGGNMCSTAYRVYRRSETSQTSVRGLRLRCELSAFDRLTSEDNAVCLCSCTSHTKTTYGLHDVSTLYLQGYDIYTSLRTTAQLAALMQKRTRRLQSRLILRHTRTHGNRSAARALLVDHSS